MRTILYLSILALSLAGCTSERQTNSTVSALNTKTISARIDEAQWLNIFDAKGPVLVKLLPPEKSAFVIKGKEQASYLIRVAPSSKQQWTFDIREGIAKDTKKVTWGVRFTKLSQKMPNMKVVSNDKEKGTIVAIALPPAQTQWTVDLGDYLYPGFLNFDIKTTQKRLNVTLNTHRGEPFLDKDNTLSYSKTIDVSKETPIKVVTLWNGQKQERTVKFVLKN